MTPREEEKFDRKIQKMSKNIQRLGIVGLIILIILFSFYSFYKFHRWSGENQWRNPIIWEWRFEIRSPIKKVNRTVIELSKNAPKMPLNEGFKKETNITPIPTGADYIKTLKHARLVDAIWFLESRKGTNKNEDGLHNICKAQGLSNEFGYLTTPRCHENFEIVALSVNNWLERELKNKTIPQALCYYNLGKVVDNCIYYQHYLKYVRG